MREWFTKRPGAPPVQECGDGCLILFGDDYPSVVRLPPELGGSEVRVLSAVTAPCPRCEAPVRHLILEHRNAPGVRLADDDTVFCVAECPRCTFLWHARKELPDG